MKCLVRGFLGHRDRLVGGTQYVRTLFTHPPTNVEYLLPTSLKEHLQYFNHYDFLMNSDTVDVSKHVFHHKLRHLTNRIGWNVNELETLNVNEGDIDLVFSCFNLVAKSNKPYVAAINTDSVITKNPASRNNLPEKINMDTRLGRLYQNTVMKKTLSSTNLKKLLFRSETAMEKSIKAFPEIREKSCVHYPAVEIPKQKKRGDDGTVRLCFVGSDWVRKGLMVLLNVFDELKQKYDIELFIVTEPSFNVIDFDSKVTVFNNLHYSEVFPKLYQDSDIFVLPTRYELFGMAAVEAMACGLPVVMSHAYASHEIVADGVTGFLTDYGDVEALKEKLSQLIEDSSLRNRMGSAGRKHVEEKFSIPRFQKELAGIFEESIKS